MNRGNHCFLSHWCKFYDDTGLGRVTIKEEGRCRVMEQKRITCSHYSGLERDWIISIFPRHSSRLMGGIKLLPQLFETIK